MADINTNKTQFDNSVADITPDKFNDYFVNISKRNHSSLPSCRLVPEHLVSTCIHSDDTLFLLPVDEYEVSCIINRLSNSTSKDIFGLSNRLLKTVRDGIIEPLKIIINRCFECGTFPKKLKFSRVSPVFKGGDKCDPGNYRPISVVPALAKPIEMAFYDRLTGFLGTNKLFSESQFGFRRGLSTAHAMTRLVADVLEAFEGGGFVTATFCDLSKAFDCVCHQILLNKLPYYGIRGSSLRFVESYLTHRWQLVEYRKQISSTLPVEDGVPQGSILGPLLFILYMNDLSYHTSARIIQYADDTTAYLRGSMLDQLRVESLSAMGELENWFCANKVCLNTNKTQTFDFTLKQLNNDLTEIKFLGLYLDREMTFKPHIAHLCGKLSSINYLLRKVAECSDSGVTRMAYMGLFQSRLMYCILAWGNSTGWLSVFRQQKMAVRIMSGIRVRESCRPYFRELQILTFPALYIRQCLMFIKSDEAGFITHDQVHTYNTRNKENLIIPQHRLEITHKNFLTNAIKMYNYLPSQIKQLPPSKFKTSIQKLLIEMCPYDLNEFFNHVW